MAAENKKQFIRIRGANENNLKNLSVDIPRDKFVVLTGLSGSGKSSLAFDTDLCRRAEKIYGISVFLCQTVPWPDGKARCGEHRGLPPAISY